MYDADVFAVITAHDALNLADSALRPEHNSKWFSKAAGGVALEPTLNSRETTPADDTQSGDVERKEVLGDRLVVTFSKLFASDTFENGLQLGRNPISSHVLLGHRGTKTKRRRDDPDPNWLMSIRREFAIIRDNPHPNVIQVLELRETPKPAMIMRYYPLGNIVNASTHQDEHVTAWGQILDGLSHLHAKGVIHRDLKPENILVERDPLLKVVIADFAMAKVATSDVLLRTFCGTLKYAAPEVFPGMSRGHGPLVDVWSLGVMVYEWLYSVVNPPDLPQRRGKTEEVFWFA
ncbi:hypothetical protein LTS01_025525 [Friedmanniomyces endolithicus]|nr:hypothetical protein LTS01_025525 [Friedmanniomyces endolithicus]